MCSFPVPIPRKELIVHPPTIAAAVPVEAVMPIREVLETARIALTMCDLPVPVHQTSIKRADVCL